MQNLLALTVAAVIALSFPASAGWDEAEAAYERGDYTTAFRELRSLAEQGDVAAQNNLAAMYERGEGVQQDYVEAVKWYRKAAEQGFAGAQTNLGYMYAMGRGVPQDLVTAHMWFSLSAAQGHEDAAMIRDMTARKMTAAEVSKAQRLTSEWLEKHGGE